MKKRLSYIMMVMLALWVCTSCNDEVIQSESYGYLSVSIENDITEDVVSKAEASTDDLAFALEVLTASGKVAASVDDHRTVTAENPIRLQIGSYSMVAKNGEKLNAAFDNPYYEGRTAENFRINPNRNTEVALTCALANTSFSVEFPVDFSKNFTEYEVSVTNGIGENLVLSNTPQAGNPLEAGFGSKAYFAVTGQLTWELYLKNIEGGEYRVRKTISDVKAKQHYHLTFEMGKDQTAEGGFVIKINLANNWDDTDHKVVLDFYQKNMPEVSVNESFSVESGTAFPVPIGNTSDKVLTFNAPEGIRSLLLIHDNPILSEKGLPESVEFVGASASLMNTLASAGFVVSSTAVKSVTNSSTSVDFDITDFVASLPVGKYDMNFSLVDVKGRCDSFNLIIDVISDVDAEASAAYTGWASFAKLEGRFFDKSKQNDITFQYRKVAETQWTDVSKSKVTVNVASMTFSAIVYGLVPSTDYVFRAVSSEDFETKEIPFSTADAEIVHNLSFDNWYMDGDAWMPNANSSNYVWDSANPGTAALGTVPTTPEESDVVKGKAARLETTTAMGMLASGNIYIGKFVKVAGLGAELDWGYNFSSRPLALKGYYKYSPKNIDMVKDPYKDKKGQGDECQIQILLTDWDGFFRINTSKKQFVDMENDPNIIAHGSLTSSKNDSGYVKFTIPLVYRNNRTPKYIVIVAAASRYGDYFTGGKGSVLKVDEFELVYDPAELTEAEFNQVFSKVSPF